jgi:hypothetical protein
VLTNTLAAAQAFLVATVFVIAGTSKLRLGSARFAVTETPLARSLPPSILPALSAALGAFELGLAGAGFLPASSRIGLAASAALLTVFTGYQIWMTRVAPGAPCGCFGAHAREAASRLTILRTSLLAIAATGGAAAGGTSGTSLPVVAAAVALAGVEGLVLALLSANTRDRALALIRRQQLVPDCTTIRVPLEVTLAALQQANSGSAGYRTSPPLRMSVSTGGRAAGASSASTRTIRAAPPSPSSPRAWSVSIPKFASRL